MFTGIVEELGEVVSLDVAPGGGDARLVVHGPTVTADARHGDSIAVSGICLTVVDFADGTFTADLMAETLDRTACRPLAAGHGDQPGALGDPDRPGSAATWSRVTSTASAPSPPGSSTTGTTRSGSACRPTSAATWPARARSRWTGSR